MTTKITATYECKKCGTRVIVNSAGLTSSDPVYCCGLPVFKTKRMTGNAEERKIDRALSDKKSGKGTSRMADAKPSGKKRASIRP